MTRRRDRKAPADTRAITGTWRDMEQGGYAPYPRTSARTRLVRALRKLAYWIEDEE